MPQGTLLPHIITNSQVIDLDDPQLLKITNRVVREVNLAAEKVAVHEAQPAEFPLPADPLSTERLLARRFNMLPQAAKKRAVLKVQQGLSASTAVRQRRWGDLATLDLRSSESIGSQVRGRPMPSTLRFTTEDLSRFTAHSFGSDTTGRTSNGGFTKLELRLHKVKCIDETGSSWYEGVGNDEIDLAGSAIDETGDTHQIAKIRVGSSFNDGKSVVYTPPRSFTTFDLTEGNVFPKSYFVVLVLAEADNGGLSDFVKDLIAKVKEKVIAALTSAIGAAIGTTGGPLGTIIGLAVGYAVGEIIAYLTKLWEDDIFPPVTVTAGLSSPLATWPGDRTDSPEAVATFIGHQGKYLVKYDWRVLA